MSDEQATEKRPNTFGLILFWGSGGLMFLFESFWFFSHWGVNGVLLSFLLSPSVVLFPAVTLFFDGVTYLFLASVVVWLIGLVGVALVSRPSVAAFSFAIGSVVTISVIAFMWLGSNRVSAPVVVSVPATTAPVVFVPTAEYLPATLAVSAPASATTALHSTPSDVTPGPVPGRTVCVQVANVRSGPGLVYPIAEKTYLGDTWSLLAKSGEWYEVTRDNKPPQGFMHQSVFCEGPPAYGPLPSSSEVPTLSLPPQPALIPTCEPGMIPLTAGACSVQGPLPNPFDTPEFSCQDSWTYQYYHGDLAERCPVVGLTKPNRIKVYYTSGETEYYTDQNAIMRMYFASVAQAEAAGFVAAHPK